MSFSKLFGFKVGAKNRKESDEGLAKNLIIFESAKLNVLDEWHLGDLPI